MGYGEDLVAAKAQRTSSKLRAANLMGLKSYLESQQSDAFKREISPAPIAPLPPKLKPEFKLSAETQLREPLLAETTTADKASRKTLWSKYRDLDVGKPREFSEADLDETRPSMATGQSTPRKGPADMSLWPSHRSLDLLEESPVGTKFADKTMWSQSRLDLDTPPSLQPKRTLVPEPKIETRDSPKRYSRLDSPQLDSQFDSQFEPTRLDSQRIESQRRESRQKIYFSGRRRILGWSKIGLHILGHLAYYLLAIALIVTANLMFDKLLAWISDSRLEAVSNRFGIGAVAWKRLYDYQIIKELDRVDALSATIY